jgi:hypothetical protein
MLSVASGLDSPINPPLNEQKILLCAGPFHELDLPAVAGLHACIEDTPVPYAGHTHGGMQTKAA